MHTPLFKKIKKNGTTLYVFPGVTEDKNFETQNENYKMGISHFALVNFPVLEKLELDPDKSAFPDYPFSGNLSGSYGLDRKHLLIESLRNYVANHEVVIRNSKVSSTDYYYDTLENFTVTEKIFWKWAKKIGAIQYELADIDDDYPSNSPQFDANSDISPNHQREYLWTERESQILNIDNIDDNNINNGSGTLIITFNGDTNLKNIKDITTNVHTDTTTDKIIINIPNLSNNPYNTDYYSIIDIDNITGTNELKNNEITITIDNWPNPSPDINNIEISLYYTRFVQFMSEITGVNNVQLPNRAYTEAYAYIAHHQGQTPYLLWRTSVDNNYKPNSSFPIINAQIQSEIQGGENANNPILTNPGDYPGGIWAQFDNGLHYETEIGDSARLTGDYFGNNNTVNQANTPQQDLAQFLSNFNAETIDGLTLDFNIDHYKKATSYVFPVETFKEFAATAFDEIPPKDFEFNCVLWFYTIEDVSGNNIQYATNLYGIEFLDSPEDEETQIPLSKKLVTNGEQDGNAYSYSLDTNIEIESYTDTFEFNPDKVYSLFGMELYYEALTRITYMNDRLSDLIGTHSDLRNEITQLRGLIYTQESVDSIRQKLQHFEDLLNVYSTLQIGDSDTIIPELDTSVSPATIRLRSIDKRYSDVVHYYTTDMFTQFENTSNMIEINAMDVEPISIKDGKDFMVVVNNDDNIIPTQNYDNTIIQDKLKLVIDKDLQFKQTLDILVVPKNNNEEIQNNTEPVYDKELELFINYNDGVLSNELLLKTIPLPVTAFKDTSSIEEEASTYFETSKSWNVENVYFEDDTNYRKFFFDVKSNFELNPKLEVGMRILMEDFKIARDPDPTIFNDLSIKPTYIDLSKQYEIQDVKLIGYNIVSSELISGGTSYNVGAKNIDVHYIDENDGLIHIQTISDGIYITSVSGTNEITSYNFTSNMNNFNYGHILFIEVNDVGNGAKINVVCETLSRVQVSINYDSNIQDIITTMDNYDAYQNFIGITGMLNITRFLQKMPIMTLYKGMKISITRISDKKDTPPNLIEERYNIKTEYL